MITIGRLAPNMQDICQKKKDNGGGIYTETNMRGFVPRNLWFSTKMKTYDESDRRLREIGEEGNLERETRVDPRAME